MNNLNEKRFDAYLNNEMTGDERVQFEQDLQADTTLREEFEAHHDFVEQLQEGIEYGEIRLQLKNIHNKPGVVKHNLLLSPKFLIPLAVAASLALIITVINPFVNQGNETADAGDYQELNVSPSMTQSEMVENSLVADSTYSMAAENAVDDMGYFCSPEFLPEIATAPNGTAFLISEEGYFLTSKHLVTENELITLQQKDNGLTFEAEVVYTDSLADFAILRCHEVVALEFNAVPFKFFKKDIQLGQDVFTLGYPKNDIVYTKGVISSEKGYKSDTLSFEVSLPSNPGYSGAPLFTYDGDLVGIVIANNTKQQAVTYVLNHHYIQQMIQQLAEKDTMEINMKTNYTKRYKQHSNLVDSYRPFIFEVHP